MSIQVPFPQLTKSQMDTGVGLGVTPIEDTGLEVGVGKLENARGVELTEAMLLLISKTREEVKAGTSVSVGKIIIVVVKSITEDLRETDGVNMLKERVNSSEDIGISMVLVCEVGDGERAEVKLDVPSMNDVSGKLRLEDGERVGNEEGRKTVELTTPELITAVGGKVAEDPTVNTGEVSSWVNIRTDVLTELAVIMGNIEVGGIKVSVGRRMMVVDSGIVKDENSGDTIGVKTEIDIVSSAEDIGKSGLSEKVGVGSTTGVVENINISVVIGGTMDAVVRGEELVGTSMLDRMVKERVGMIVITTDVLSNRDGEKDSVITGREVAGSKVTEVCTLTVVLKAVPNEGEGLAVKSVLEASEVGITLVGGITSKEKLDELALLDSELGEGAGDTDDSTIDWLTKVFLEGTGLLPCGIGVEETIGGVTVSKANSITCLLSRRLEVVVDRDFD